MLNFFKWLNSSRSTINLTRYELVALLSAAETALMAFDDDDVPLSDDMVSNLRNSVDKLRQMLFNDR